MVMVCRKINKTKNQKTDTARKGGILIMSMKLYTISI